MSLLLNETDIHYLMMLLIFLAGVCEFCYSSVFREFSIYNRDNKNILVLFLCYKFMIIWKCPNRDVSIYKDNISPIFQGNYFLSTIIHPCRRFYKHMVIYIPEICSFTVVIHSKFILYIN